MGIKYYPMVWILWGNDSVSSTVKLSNKRGVHIVELFAHKIDAEKYMRTCKEDDVYGHYWIQEKEVFQ
jgi:N-acetyl-anhydromuramyl-L-alanine amidase AmpD